MNSPEQDAVKPKTILAADKPMLGSKKFVVALIGAGNVAVVYATSILLFIYKPELATQVQSLAGTVIAFNLAVISILITGQSAVEWSQKNAIEATVKDERETRTERKEIVERIEHVVVAGQPGAPAVRPFRQIPEEDHADAEEAEAAAAGPTTGGIL